MRNFQDYTKFFDTKGLTSTSANYISNMAKELVKTINIFDGISFENILAEDFSKTGASRQIQSGITPEEFADLEKNLEIKAKLNSLISWFREAIKARESQLEQTERYSFTEWMQEVKGIDDLNFGEVIPEYDSKKFHLISEAEYIEQNFSVKEMNRYFYLQNMCSTLGKFVHPNGVYARAKEEIAKKDKTSYIKETHSSNILYTVTSSIPIQEIDEKFFQLQDKQREYQKQFNEMKFAVEKAVTKYNDERKAEEQTLSAEIAEINARISAKSAQYKKEFFQWKVDELNRLRSLKIIIPDDLRQIYEYVSSYGKQHK